MRKSATSFCARRKWRRLCPRRASRPPLSLALLSDDPSAVGAHFEELLSAAIVVLEGGAMARRAAARAHRAARTSSTCTSACFEGDSSASSVAEVLAGRGPERSGCAQRRSCAGAASLRDDSSSARLSRGNLLGPLRNPPPPTAGDAHRAARPLIGLAPSRRPGDSPPCRESSCSTPRPGPLGHHGSGGPASASPGCTMPARSLSVLATL